VNVHGKQEFFMKLIIHSSDRKEYVHLPEREPDDLPRMIRSGEAHAPERTMLGQSSPTEPQHLPIESDEEMGSRDLLGEFLEDNEPEASDETELEHEASWKHSRWPGVLFVAALVVLGAIWYLASRSDNGLKLAQVHIEGANLLSNEEILELAAIDRTIPFYAINLKQIEQRLLTHSLIRAAHVRRELDPATLVLSIEERQPVALLKADSTSGTSAGETFIIDRDGLLLRPKLIAGLRDPAKILQVPLLSGVSTRDTAGFQAMATLVTLIAAQDSGALKNSIGELRRTPTGAYVIYTSETETPIFLGTPFDREFHTALEEQRDSIAPKNQLPLFYRQLQLLARLWKPNVQNEIRAGHALYIDARFSGQIILKHKSQPGMSMGIPGSQTISQSETNHPHYATNANKRSTN
jgi:cell division septal protein FtsQ